MSQDWNEYLKKIKMEAEEVRRVLERARARFEELVANSDAGLCPEEKAAIVSYLLEVEEQRLKPSDSSPFSRLPFDFLMEAVEGLWWEPQAPSVPDEARIDVPSEALQVPPSDFSEFVEFDYLEVVTPEAEPEEWGFHMTNDFRKSVKDLDKSMRGRVLDAIAEICQHPTQLRGDTVKPLNGELSGCWRYRIGNYRLIYLPITDAHRIDLITIGGRGSVYGH